LPPRPGSGARYPAGSAPPEADELESTGDFVGALAAVDRVLADNPNDVAALERSAVLMTGLGKLSEAVERYRRLTGLEPRNARYLADLGDLLVALERSGEAVDVYEQAVTCAPRDPAIRQSLARAHRALGDTAKAVATLDQAIELEPTRPELRVDRGDAILDEAVERQDGSIAFDAVNEFGTATELGGPRFSANEWLVRADRVLSAGLTGAALEMYRRSLDVEGTAQAWRGTGLAQQQLDRFDLALEAYERARHLDPKNAQLANDLGYALLKLDRLTEAVEAFRQVVELDETHVAGWQNLGYTLRCLGELEPARDAFLRAAELDGTSADAWVSVGLCDLDISVDEAGLEQALSRFRAAIDRDSRHFWALNNAGWVRFKQGNYAAASELLERAIAVGEPPDVSMAILNKVRLLSVTGERDEAERLARQFLTESPGSTAALCLAEVLSEWQGDDQAALEVLQHAADQSPEERQLVPDLMELNLKVGRTDVCRELARTWLDTYAADVDDVATRLAVLYMRFASYVVAGETSDARDAAFAGFADYFRDEYVHRRRAASYWEYRGLKRALRSMRLPAESLFMLLTLLDLQHGAFDNSRCSFFDA
jgi:tetratricopeptide (TPR) repeat protein